MSLGYFSYPIPTNEPVLNYAPGSPERVALKKALADLKKKPKTEKPQDIVFLLDGANVKAAPVKRGISDDNYYEVLEGVTEGQEVVSGNYKAISKDLEDGKLVKVDNKPKATKPEDKK